MTALPAGWYVDPADSTRYRYWRGERWTTHVQNRAQVDIAAAEADMVAAARPLPDFDDPDGTAPGATTGRRRVPVLLAVVALAAIVGTGVVVASGRGDTGQTLGGEVRVDTASVRGGGTNEDVAPGDGEGCGTGSEGSVGAGSVVTVSNARGDVLGRSELQAGRLDRTPTATTCVFPYEVTGVDDAAVYLVQVAEGRPTRTTRAQVEADRGRIDVLVG